MRHPESLSGLLNSSLIILNQLLEDELTFNTTSLNTVPYIDFLNFVERLFDNEIWIYSLNHDLLIEHLISTSSFADVFHDGFSEIDDTLFYGIDNTNSRVRLRYFCNRFSSDGVNLLKLHGSIDNYKFLDQ